MEKTFFRYRKHPGDFLRNTDLLELPNPDENLEDFLISFLDHYQSDSRIAYINDLDKLLYDEFTDELEISKFIEEIGEKSKLEIQEEIKQIETELKDEAFKNFYQLLLENKIEVLFQNPT
jgi:hypothetical protein